MDVYQISSENNKNKEYFDRMYNTLEELINKSTGHLMCCSNQFGKPEDCHICRKTINLLHEIDVNKIKEQVKLMKMKDDVLIIKKQN